MGDPGAGPPRSRAPTGPRQGRPLQANLLAMAQALDFIANGKASLSLPIR